MTRRFRLGLVLALLGLALGCRGDRESAGAREETPTSLPLERLEPLVREQLEDALARAESGDADQLAHLGLLSYSYGFPEQAATWLRRALSVSGDDPRWWHALGLALSELGRPEPAALAFEEVLRTHPDDSPARLRLAEALLELGRVGEALEQFEAVSSTGGTNEVHGLAGAGRALVRLDRPHRARQQLEAALEREPRHAQARYALATLLRDEGRLEESARQFQRAQSDWNAAPPIDDPVARMIDGLSTGAATALQRGIAVRRRSADYAAAAALFEEAVRLDPGLAEAHAELGAARLALGDLPRAEASLREALRLEPESANALYNLAWIAHREGRNEEALRGFRAAAEIRPDDFDVLLGLGVAALAAGLADEGVSAMTRASAARPADPRPYRYLDTHYSSTGQEAAAIDALRRGRLSLPDDLSLAMRLSWHLATTSRAVLREPQRALELARTVARSTDHPKALDTLAVALAANRLFQEAAEIARRAETAAEARGDTDMMREIQTRRLRYESERDAAR